MRIIIALLIFGIIVFIHELGHFLFAKLSHIKVNEFSVGMGPRLISKDIGETKYSIKLLPIGGSCAMEGEDFDEEAKAGSFNSASTIGRLLTIAAGPIFNFILAFVLGIILVSMVGTNKPVVTEVPKNSHAYESGLREGDIITRFNGHKIRLGKQLYVYTAINKLGNKNISLEVKRDGKNKELLFKPSEDKRYILGFMRNSVDSNVVEDVLPQSDLYKVGIKKGDVLVAIGNTKISNGEDYNKYVTTHKLSNKPIKITFKRGKETIEKEVVPYEEVNQSLGFAYNLGNSKVKGLNIIKGAFNEVSYVIDTTFMSLKALFTGQVSVKSLSGPVGVVNVIGNAYSESITHGIIVVIESLLSLSILISANLGVMNLLPIPALDGGRILFILIEVITRRRINKKVEGYINIGGFIFLMCLMVFLVINDIINLI